MRSYALFLALAVLQARAATIPAPDNDKNLSSGIHALDDVSLDNNESEQELVASIDSVKDVENNLRNSIPDNVPVKIVEEQPVTKKIALEEDSNDYVPDNDDSTNIKRVEIDLNNPGPPQRQEHDSQIPVTYYSYVDKERAVAAIKQSIAESQNIFTRGLQDVTHKFKCFFENNEQLPEVSEKIQTLRKNFDAEVVKLSKTINHYLKPDRVEVAEGAVNIEIPTGIKEVENRLKTLQTNFDYGVGMLSEGVELLSILKEEDEQNLKISGKADNVDVPSQIGTPAQTAPANPTVGATPTNPTGSNPVLDYIQNMNATMSNAFNNLVTQITNFFNPSQNQNTNPSANATSTNQGGFNPANFFQGINIPNFFQQNPNPPQQGTAPAATQSSDVATTERPNILQQIQSTFQNIVNPGQPAQQQPQPIQNPITQFFSNVNQGISNFFQPKPDTQQPQQTNQPISHPAAAVPVAAEGTNSVPAAPAQREPPIPVKESEAIQSAPVENELNPNGPIQQIVQNNPIVKGITSAVQRVQGLSNPSKPRDTNVENPGSKGHGDGTSGDSISRVDDIKKQPETIPEKQDGGEITT